MQYTSDPDLLLMRIGAAVQEVCYLFSYLSLRAAL